MKTFLLLLLVFLLPLAVLAQSVPPNSPAPDPNVSAADTKLTGIPVLTGYGGFVTSFEPNETEIKPVLAPILLVPFGEKWLAEAEGEFEGTYTKMQGEPWEREWEKGVEYLQLNYLANKYITFTAGRYLVPFGTYNERLHPSWIKNLQEMPILMGIATGSGNGGMVRGGIGLSSKVNLNYAAYFSALSTTRALESSRVAGSRVGLYFTEPRIEIGTSFQRTLQDERFNTYGFDWSWQPRLAPLDIRGEFATNDEQGKGYWLEGAYRLRKIPFARPVMRNSQVVARVEQFFAPAAMSGMTGMSGGDEMLPDVDTNTMRVGWNYYVNDAFKLSFSGGRTFSEDGNHNVFTLGISYRLFAPLGRGTK